MSDYRAIGGVSATLQRLLQDRMDLPDELNDEILVAVGAPPPPPANEPAAEDPRITLFLYRVNENGALKNQEIPGNGSAGAYGRPPLALNLHYLVTASGNKQVRKGGAGAGAAVFDDTLAHFLLGSAMRVLHDYAQISDSLVTVRVPSGDQILHESLRDAYEHVKLTLEPLSLEDVTKVWTALALRYRLSAAYAITVVQIESRTPRSFPRPVGAPASAATPPAYGSPAAPGPNVLVVTTRMPYITEIRVRRLGETADRALPYARIGDTLVILGTQLGGGDVSVVMGGLEIPVTPVDDRRVEAIVPDASIPGAGTIPDDQRLQPGPLVVSVNVRPTYLPASVTRSNESVVMLVPAVTLPLAYDAATRALTITGTRLWHPKLAGETIVGRSAIGKIAYTSASETAVVVTLPDTLPAAPVATVIGTALPGTVAIPALQGLTVTVDGAPLTVAPHWPSSLPFADVPALLANAIHDAAAATNATNVPAFTRARVGTLGTQLAVVPGTLGSSIAIGPALGSTLAGALGFGGVALPGAANAALSGQLAPFPPFAGPAAVTVKIGAGSLAVSLAPPLSLADLAAKLQAALNAGPGPSYANALVGTVGQQLLVVPGTASNVAFDTAPPDTTSVAALQLRAAYGVRVRVKGAESFDDAAVVVPS